MRRFHPALALVFIALFSMACNFSTRINDQQAAATIEPLPTAVEAVDVVESPQRPQTAFIDGRDQPEGTVNQGEVVSVQPNTSNAQSLLVAQSGEGGSGGAYASGGYSGGTGSYSQPGSYAAQGGYGSCCYQPPPPPQCTPNYSWQYTYVIQRGDTLSRIARAAGITTQQLAAANCIANPNLIYPGQVIKVPCYIPPPPVPCCHQPPPHYPPPHHPTYPPPVYPTPLPPTAVVPPPVVIGSALTFSPVDSINNNTVILPPDVLVTISWSATFPTATERVVFELIPPGMGSGSPIGIDTNLGDGASIVWNSVNGTQGTVRAVAYFTGGYAPQISDFYYIIAGFPIT